MGAVLLMTVAAMFAAHAAAAQTQAPTDAGTAPRRQVPLTRETAQQRRDNFERGWPTIDATLKRWSSLNNGPRDFRGVAPAFDVKGYVFPIADRPAFEARRVEAGQQFDGGDWPGAILLYGLLIEQANGIITRLQDVSGYWIWYQTHERRMARWRRALRTNDLVDANGPQIDALESQIKSLTRDARFGEPASGLMKQVDGLFRQSVDAARAAAPGGLLRDDPPVARYGGIEGATVVRARVTSSGCVAYAEVARSSGSELLDDAAMDWTVEAARLDSAIGVDDKPVAATFQFVVRFSLY